MKLYAIRDKRTGKFATKGYYTKWVDQLGKNCVWQKLGFIKNHIHLVSGEKRQTYRLYCDIVEFDLVEVSTIPLCDFVDKLITIEEANEVKRQYVEKLRKEKCEREQFEKLKEKYEN